MSRVAPRLAWIVLALSVAMAAGGLAFLFLTISTPIPDVWGVRGKAVVFGLAFSAVGALIASRKPGNPIGWIFLLGGSVSSFSPLMEELAAYALLAKHGTVPGGMAAGWIQHWIWIPWVGLELNFLLLLFPDGKPVSGRWRPLLWLAVFASAFATLTKRVQPRRARKPGRYSKPVRDRAPGRAV